MLRLPVASEKGLAAELLGGSDHYCNVIAVQQDQRTQGFGGRAC
jgi:hypothetical protein